MRNNREKSPCYRFYERFARLEADEELNKIISDEFEKYKEVLECYQSRIRDSVSCSELALNFQDFSEFFSLIRDNIVNKIMKYRKWRRVGKEYMSFLFLGGGVST